MAKHIWLNGQLLELPERKNRKVADLEKRLWETALALDDEGLAEIEDVFAHLANQLEVIEEILRSGRETTKF